MGTDINMATNTSSGAFFEAKYAAAADPWRFATSLYERERYSKILSVLRGRRYQRAFEPGCSIGVLTAGLAELCDSVEAIDISPTAVDRARKRCRNFANVRVTKGQLPGDVPDGVFDLIVFSEIGYYFEPAALFRIATQLAGRLSSGGIFLAAHWLGASPDHRLKGDEVHALLGRIPGFERTLAERHEGFRMERWIRR
jgi:SAM-dependent methyltransferase